MESPKYNNEDLLPQMTTHIKRSNNLLMRHESVMSGMMNIFIDIASALKISGLYLQSQIVIEQMNVFNNYMTEWLESSQDINNDLLNIIKNDKEKWSAEIIKNLSGDEK